MSKFKFETTKYKLTNKVGLSLIDQLWKKLDLDHHFDHSKKAKSLIYSFLAGIHNLSDIDRVNQDYGIGEFVRTYRSTTIGSFLSKLSLFDIGNLANQSLNLSFALRKLFFADERDFILSMDSTPHTQTGKKMEGVTWNYKNQWCLDSQNAYDQFGISYACDLRPGSTHSSVGSTYLIDKIFSKVKGMNKYFRADSAYANKNNYNALLMKKVKFAMPLKSNITKRLLKINKNTLSWEKVKDLKFFNSDKCELSIGRYPIKGLYGDLKELKVVILRAPLESKQMDIFDDEIYKYYCLVTNIDSTEKTIEEIFKFYMKRSNCENFIRDQKYGFDFLHFPSRKLSKNKAYAIYGTIAYNFTRVMSYLIDPQKGCFAKRVRSTLFDLPAIVIKHARRTVFRLNSQAKEVIEKFMNKINFRYTRYIKIYYSSS